MGGRQLAKLGSQTVCSESLLRKFAPKVCSESLLVCTSWERPGSIRAAARAHTSWGRMAQRKWGFTDEFVTDVFGKSESTNEDTCPIGGLRWRARASAVLSTRHSPTQPTRTIPSLPAHETPQHVFVSAHCAPISREKVHVRGGRGRCQIVSPTCRPDRFLDARIRLETTAFGAKQAIA